MYKPMMLTREILSALASLSLLACGKPVGEAPSKTLGAATVAPLATGAEDLVARVNGAAITQQDIRLKLKNEGHKQGEGPNLDNVLETVIREELAAQRAAELGLDKDARYREGLRKVEAQVAAYRRRALSELYWERSVDKSAAPTEADAKRYFEEHEKEIRTQIHVKQILRRGEAAMTEVVRQIDGGKSFDEVAGGLFPNRPPGTAPWDLGYLSWYKLPDAWRAVVPRMAKGQVSGVIRGPNERYWVLQVVDRKEDPGVTFEAAKAAILVDLTRARVDEAREKARKELSEKARVERVAAPTAGPIPAPEE